MANMHVPTCPVLDLQAIGLIFLPNGETTINQIKRKEKGQLPVTHTHYSTELELVAKNALLRNEKKRRVVMRIRFFKEKWVRVCPIRSFKNTVKAVSLSLFLHFLTCYWPWLGHCLRFWWQHRPSSSSLFFFFKDSLTWTCTQFFFLSVVHVWPSILPRAKDRE